MSDNSYKFIYWDDPDTDSPETHNNKPKTFSESLEDEE